MQMIRRFVGFYTALERAESFAARVRGQVRIVYQEPCGFMTIEVWA